MAQRDIGNLRTRLSWEDEGAARSLEGFRRDLRGLRSEMNVLRSQGREYTTSLKGLRQQADILNRTYKTQQERVRELRRRYEESVKIKGEDANQTRDLNRQYNNAVAEMNRTERQLKEVTEAIENQINPWRRLGRNMETAGQRMQTFGRGMSSVGRTMTMRVTTPILGVAGAALKVAADFEEGMSRVQAISGATGEELAELESLARELGATTRFSATEAASGMEFLAMAGFEVNEIVAAMPGLLDLAASSNMDLGRAADIASNILSGFGMEATEAGRVADVLAAAASSANTNVEQLGGAMQYAAPIAATLGLSIEELTAAVGFMSDAGIQGEQAGRQLRQGLLRLANPTGRAADLMEELGINVFDAEGNMKSMPEVINELSKGLGDMESDARAAALATLFGAESTAGWSVLLDRGARELADYTKELENSKGAASDMAKTMEDNAKGSMREFRSAAEEAGIAASEHLLPAFTDLVEKGTELIRRFGELDESTQKNIIRIAGFAAALGPAAVVTGNLTTAAGGLVRVGGRLSSLLGRKGGTGLLGRIGLLGISGGPVGLAIAGVGALSLGIYKLVRDSREAREVNLEYADSMREQADALEETVDRFDELRIQSGLTTEEFSRLVDITKELSTAQDPSRVQALQEEFNKLAEKSGLSNDELNEMVGLNDKIVEQSPSVEKSFTNQGNAVVGATDAVREYINSLREMAVEELYVERIKALENEKELREENKRLNEEIAEIESKINQFVDLRNLSEDQIKQRLEEINREMNTGLLTQEEYLELQKEQDLLLLLQNGKLGEGLDAMQKQREELIKKLEKNEEELQKVDEVNNAYIEALLIQAGINTEKGNGIELLDQEIEKLKEQKQQLQEKYKNQEISNFEYQEGIEKLDKEINNLEDVRKKIREAVGETGRQNRAVDDVNRQYSRMEREIRNIRSRQRGTNEEIDRGTDKARNMTRELDKDVKKNVKVDDRGTARKVQREAEKPATKNVTLRARWAGVQAGLRIALSGILRGFAKGTNYAPGGPALVGEEGPELARLGNRWSMLDFGIVDIPRGTQIFTHDETKKIVAALNRLPAYANGISYPGEADRVVRQLNDQQQRLPLTGEAVIYTTVINQIDGREFSRHTYRHITELQQMEERRAARARGEG